VRGDDFFILAAADGVAVANLRAAGQQIVGNRVREVKELLGFVPGVRNLDLHLVEGLHPRREQPERAVIVRFDAKIDPKMQGQILPRGAACFLQEDVRFVNEPAAVPVDSRRVDVDRDRRGELSQRDRSP